MTRARDLADSADKDIAGTLTLDGLTVAGNVSADGGTIKLDGNYPNGVNNVALGNAALDTASGANGYSVAIGTNALTAMTTGGSNTGVGFGAAAAINSGSNNTALGTDALASATGANFNTVVGSAALYNNTANYNTVMGRQAAYTNTSGEQNVILGGLAFYSNSTGSYNVALGMESLHLNSSASNNTAVGFRAGYANTTGVDLTAIGYKAGTANTTGQYNTFVGKDAGLSNTTSGFSTYTGEYSGRSTTGERNTFYGQQSGTFVTTGSKNTIIGRFNGNQGGLDIRTSSNNIVLSDGDGNARLNIDSNGHIYNAGAISGMGLGFGRQALSIKSSSGSSAVIFEHTGYNNTSTMLQTVSGTSYGGNMIDTRCGTSQTSAYNFEIWRSGGANDVEFKLRGDGQAYADGSWNGGGADYAEYFEWADGNPDNEDRRGYSVVLEDSKMRKAIADDDAALIFGVISARPSMIGDADIGAWKSKYLKDDFGAYQRDENDERILNPDYDPDQEYTSREDRPEWDTVGLMGKLRIRKGQPTGSNWIKMRDVSDTVEEWLVR